MSNKPSIMIANTAYTAVARKRPTKAQAAAASYNKLMQAANVLGQNDKTNLVGELLPIPQSITLVRISPKMSKKTAKKMTTKNPEKLRKEIQREVNYLDASQ